MARDAVFRSWNNDRAIFYRKQHNISDSLGTAVNVQAMVFGNKGKTSGTGVGFTRNPATGAKEFYGEYLLNAQGEDVVAGIRTPKPIAELETGDAGRSTRSCARSPAVWRSTIATCRTSSSPSRTACSTCCRRAAASAPRRPRSGSPSRWCNEGLITKEEALLRVEPSQLDQLLHPRIDPKRAGHGAGQGAGGLARARRSVRWSSIRTRRSK